MKNRRLSEKLIDTVVLTGALLYAFSYLLLWELTAGEKS